LILSPLTSATISGMSIFIIGTLGACPKTTQPTIKKSTMLMKEGFIIDSMSQNLTTFLRQG